MRTLRLRKTATIAALFGAVLLAAPGAANAAVVTGWVGPAGSNGAGVQFLNTSTIINSPNLTAESKIYSIFGQQVAPGDIGVRARLFKSGALCEAVGYKYSSTGTASLTVGTTATCGTGSYNSHGFTAVWDGSTYREALTFPSNPLDWTAPAARSAGPTESTTVDSGTNAAGQSFGPGDVAATDAELPDLVAAIGSDGVQGYIQKTDLDSGAASPAEASTLEKQNIGGTEVLGTAPKTVPVYAEDGTTQISEFTIS